MPKDIPNSGRRMSAAQHRRAVVLRARGWKMDRIAKELGCTDSAVSKILKRAA